MIPQFLGIDRSNHRAGSSQSSAMIQQIDGVDSDSHAKELQAHLTKT